MSNRTRTIPVVLSGASYDVLVGASVLASLGARVRGLLPGARRALVVSDSNLPERTVASARESLAGAGCAVIECRVTATEEDKSLASLQVVLEHAARGRLERGEPVVALGGGIVGDLAGFAAAVYRRGVPIVQCPTTLLSMVDASVGGKTGVNLSLPVAGVTAGARLKKNMVGSFHQPALVLCDVGTLESLPPREFRSGLAECIKHALLGSDWDDAGLLEWTRVNLRRVLSGDQDAGAELVERNVAIKARVVRADEREERDDHLGRMALNMGHTVGHAIEPLACRPVATGEAAAGATEGLLHGEAVGLGMIAEAVCAERLHAAAPGTARRVEELLEQAGLPVRAAGLPGSGELIDAMRDDKKVKQGAIRIAAPTGGPGRGDTSGTSACIVIESPSEEALLAAFEAIRMV